MNITIETECERTEMQRKFDAAKVLLKKEENSNILYNMDDLESKKWFEKRGLELTEMESYCILDAKSIEEWVHFMNRVNPSAYLKKMPQGL